VKWLITFLVVAAVAVFAWITLQDTRELDARSAVVKAHVVAYGRVFSSPRPHMVIDEIWKRSGASESIRIGTVVGVPVADSSFDHVLVCFTQHMFSHRLSPSAIFAVRGDGVGLPAVPLSDLKALCAATPST
jgi:heme/copper-type cytochrome/quinol oxidase subunit 2